VELDALQDAEDIALAERLAGLRETPTPQARARIMSAVRSAATPATLPRRRAGWRGRLVATAVAMSAALIGGTVAAFAASANALPDSPAYAVRVAGENVRLALADVHTKEHLRGEFAKARLRQFGQLHPGEQQAGQTLLRDARRYVDQAENDINKLSAREQDDVRKEINDLQNQEQQDERQSGPTGGGESSPGPGSRPNGGSSEPQAPSPGQSPSGFSSNSRGGNSSPDPSDQETDTHAGTH